MARPRRVFIHIFLNITQINSANFTEIWQFYTLKLQGPFEAVDYGSEISKWNSKICVRRFVFATPYLNCYSRVDRCSMCSRPYRYDCSTKKHEKNTDISDYCRRKHCVNKSLHSSCVLSRLCEGRISRPRIKQKPYIQWMLSNYIWRWNTKEFCCLWLKFHSNCVDTIACCKADSCNNALNARSRP